MRVIYLYEMILQPSSLCSVANTDLPGNSNAKARTYVWHLSVIFCVFVIANRVSDHARSSAFCNTETGIAQFSSSVEVKV